MIHVASRAERVAVPPNGGGYDGGVSERFVPAIKTRVRVFADGR